MPGPIDVALDGVDCLASRPARRRRFIAGLGETVELGTEIAHAYPDFARGMRAEWRRRNAACESLRHARAGVTFLQSG